MGTRQGETPPSRHEGVDAVVAGLPGNGVEPGRDVYAEAGCRTR
jgi:hypothetical protein